MRFAPADLPCFLEPLEPRLLLSRADWFGVVTDTSSDATRDIRWRGDAIESIGTQWIVTLNSNAAKRWGSVDAAAARLDLDAIDGQVLQGLGQRGRILIEVGDGVSRRQLLRWLRSSNAVDAISPNEVLTATQLADDPQFNQLWGLNNTGQTGGAVDADIDATEAWEYTTGSSSVVVAVIDTGIDYTHVDLAANMWRNPGEIAGNGIDDDGNGFVDDVYGYDFADGDSDPMDTEGHGTHVAGTIAAVGDNDAGVTGVAWDASLMALKIFDADGDGSTSAAVQAINYMIMMRSDYDVNVRVANASWGGSLPDNTLYAAIADLADADILFVAAAGNDGSNNDRFFGGNYPASFNLANIISVTATDDSDTLPTFSNTGASTVDLAAPGDAIRSTLPGNTYGTYSGTSMAAPHVTGVAVLLWSIEPTLTYAQVKSAILSSVDKLGILSGQTVSGGRLNAAKAIQAVLNDTDDDDDSDQTSDIAGNSPDEALALGRLKKAQAVSDSVGGDDGSDYYAFTVTGSKNVEIKINRQSSSGNARVKVLRSHGRLIAATTTAGKNAGVLDVALTGGTYLVKVVSKNGATTTYRLRLSQQS